ncbi:MAG: hypothetical protein D3909_07270, partial [Candidatus Electrothrix sp. ATG1]|nr:hypothetical protein [Candidatus Electrothrix sp. ATG1]
MYGSAAKTKSTTSTARSHSNAAAVQARLSVGKKNDQYEQEADRVADTVVAPFSAPGKTDHTIQRSPITSIASARTAPKISRLSDIRAQRQDQEEKEEPAQAKLQRQAEEKEEPAQAKL